MVERREENIKCLEDIATIKAVVGSIKIDVQENRESLRFQGHELIEHIKTGCPESTHIETQNGIIMDLKLEFVSLRSAIMMTNKILISTGVIAGIVGVIAGLVFGLLKYLGD